MKKYIELLIEVRQNCHSERSEETRGYDFE